jgi:osmotically-inducible protein OsmY
MKLQKLRSGIAVLMVAGALAASSCKDKAKETDNTSTATGADTTSTATIQMDTSTVATDDVLTTQLKDATKDYPGVTATADNGEVTLTGTIKRDKLQNLLQAVHALNPKKVNNQLTIE